MAKQGRSTGKTEEMNEMLSCDNVLTKFVFAYGSCNTFHFLMTLISDSLAYDFIFSQLVYTVIFNQKQSIYVYIAAFKS
jgi:hypothetical protein